MSIFDIWNAQALLGIALLLKNALEWLLRKYDCKKFKNEIEEDLKKISSEHEKITSDLKRFSVNFNSFVKKLLHQEISDVEDMKENLEKELHSLFDSIISFFEGLRDIKYKMCYYASDCLKSPRDRANFRIKIDSLDKKLEESLDLWEKTREYADTQNFKQMLIDVGLDPEIVTIILDAIKKASLEDILSIKMLKNFRERFRKAIKDLIEAGKPYRF